MRNFFIVFFIGFSCLAFLSSIWADKVPTTGKWDSTGLRSSIPAPPEASVEGNTVSIYFPDALSDLTVYIMQGSKVVYQTVISANSGNTQDLPWAGQPGNYQILMTHYYGYQGGDLTIE